MARTKASENVATKKRAQKRGQANDPAQISKRTKKTSNGSSSTDLGGMNIFQLSNLIALEENNTFLDDVLADPPPKQLSAKAREGIDI